ncbi:hypothetical protein PIB30_000918 [Stylosanthes scabra]|uniref:Uncharacterized protein n=1 Tax=Stylosanthes scabra TaxID=79078 RepID=A0ABU6S2Y0_9FABA|nr:hypothetical protein [Stylosanthes scabra]
MYQYEYGSNSECWEQDMGRIMMNKGEFVGSEQEQDQSYEPYFRPLQYDEVPVAAWNFELPLMTGTGAIDAVESCSILCSSSSSSADSYSSSEKCKNVPSSSYSHEKHNSASDFQPPLPAAANDVLIFHQQYHHNNNKLVMGDHDDDDATDHKKPSPLQICFQKNQTEKQEYVMSGCSNSGYRRGPSSLSVKRRIRWTKDLHEPFMTVVNRLGGPHKAKPKAILDMMKSDLLSITHIKSHLQKYRSTICHHKASHERSFEEGDKTDVTHLQHKIQMQIEESQQLQQEVRRSIHQQLEMQRNLQVLIEQQREQLKMMLQQQKERKKLNNNP